MKQILRQKKIRLGLILLLLLVIIGIFYTWAQGSSTAKNIQKSSENSSLLQRFYQQNKGGLRTDFENRFEQTTTDTATTDCFTIGLPFKVFNPQTSQELLEDGNRDCLFKATISGSATHVSIHAEPASETPLADNTGVRLRIHDPNTYQPLELHNLSETDSIKMTAFSSPTEVIAFIQKPDMLMTVAIYDFPTLNQEKQEWIEKIVTDLVD